MIMLSRGVLKGQRRSWLVAVALAGGLARPPPRPCRRRDHPARLRRRAHSAHRATGALPRPGRTGHRAVRAPHPGRGRPDGHRRGLRRRGARRPGPPPPPARVAPGAARIGRTAHRRPVRALPAAHQPLRLHEPAGGGHQPRSSSPCTSSPARWWIARLSSGRASVGRRAAEIRARDIVRRHGTGSLDYFALRDDKQWFFHRDSMVAYAVFGGVCLVSPDPIGPFTRAGPRMGRLPPLRRPQRLGARRHGRRRGLASDLPGLGDALPLSRRRGDRGPPSVLPGGRQDEGAAAGGEPGRPLRLHRPLPGPGPPGSGRRGPAGRAHAEEPPGRTGARLLHDAGAALRQPRHGPPAHAGRGTRRCSRGHVPVRALDRHRRLLARPHAPRPGRASQRAAGLRVVLHHRPPEGDGDEGPEPQLCRHALHPRSRIG